MEKIAPDGTCCVSEIVSFKFWLMFLIDDRVEEMSKKEMYANLDCGRKIEDIDMEDKLVGICWRYRTIQSLIHCSVYTQLLSLMLVSLVTHIIYG